MSSRKSKGTRRPKSGSGLSQFGLIDIPNLNNMEMDDGLCDDGDDSDLEAELMALTSENTPVRPKRGRPAVPKVDLDTMVADSLRDIPSDEDLSGDDDDPELLNELTNLQEDDYENTSKELEPSHRQVPPHPVSQSTGSEGNALVSMLEGRLKLYQEAESNAKLAGESSRARRFGRGIKTLNDLIKQACAGRVVNEEDIPPPVTTSACSKPAPQTPGEVICDQPPSVPSRPAPPPPSVPPSDAIEETHSRNQADSISVDTNVLNLLRTRRDQYKVAALQAKKDGDIESAMKCVRVAKQFEQVISAVEKGQPVDLSEMPPPPSVVTQSQIREPPKEEHAQQTSSGHNIGEEMSEGEVQIDTSIYNAPSAPVTIMEALEQRLAKYQSCEQTAKEEGNSSKARRMGRIVKQYEGAIKLHKAGKPIPVDDLPTPPGFAPIPVEGATSLPPIPESSLKPAAVPAPVSPTSQGPATSLGSTSEDEVTHKSEKVNVRKSPQSRQEKQLAFLIARQREFKEAALQAKQRGEINQAKEYLRLAKGFDPLIEASKCGLPVDMATIPVPPGTQAILESDFDVISVEDCTPGSDAEIFEKLEEDLLKQTKMCLATRDHFKAIGDVTGANRFEQLALHCKNDWNTVHCAHKRCEPIPKFHYETKAFSIVQCNTELGDNDLELTVVQGINYNVSNPRDVDTYVKFEFPYPTENPVRDRTALIKDTNNPQYNQAFMLSIQRNSRGCQRVFKRHSIKIEVWSRGGFLRSDTLIGTANVKLMPLETKCTLHDSFDLMEGRKAVGGKVEIKVRVRNPILVKQVEQVQEKWLIIDSL